MAKPTQPIMAPERRHNAGVLDIRNIIGALLGVYGVILLVTGIVSDDRGSRAEVNSNLWAGIVLLAVAAAFIAWARLRPVKVPESTPDRDSSA